MDFQANNVMQHVVQYVVQYVQYVWVLGYTVGWHKPIQGTEQNFVILSLKQTTKEQCKTNHGEVHGENASMHFVHVCVCVLGLSN